MGVHYVWAGVGGLVGDTDIKDAQRMTKARGQGLGREKTKSLFNFLNCVRKVSSTEESFGEESLLLDKSFVWHFCRGKQVQKRRGSRRSTEEGGWPMQPRRDIMTLNMGEVRFVGDT